MHIAFLTSEYPHERVLHAAGIATSIKNLVVALVEKEVKVSVFVYGQKENTVLQDGAVNLYLIKHKTYRVLGWYLHRKHIQNYLNVAIVAKGIDIIEAPDWTGITAFMNLKAPLVIRLHGSDAYFCKLEHRKQKFKNFVFEKYALKKAKGFIAPTTFAGKQTSKIFRLPISQIKTIHYGLKLENFQNETPTFYNRNTILYIGTIIRKKGVLELAKIFNTVVEHNPKAKLILIGNDAFDVKTGSSSTYSLMEAIFSKKAKQRQKFLGKVPYTEIKQHIKNAQIGVFPSFAETLGMVTIEAMAMQKPVVNTSIGWAQEIIDDGVNGFLVHPSKINDYAAKILQLLNDEALCQQIGLAAKHKVKTHFNIDKNVAINIGYYKTLLS